MPSESARATTASESRFRVQAPNSATRRVAVVALDADAAALAEELAAEAWNGAAFWHAGGLAARGEGLDDFLADLAGATRRVVEVVAASDLVVLLAGASGDGAAAAARRVMAAGIVLAGEADDAALSRALTTLRPHVGMLVVARDRDYAAAMMEALRA